MGNVKLLIWHHLMQNWEEMSTIISYKPVQANSSTPPLDLQQQRLISCSWYKLFAVQLQLCLRSSSFQGIGWKGYPYLGQINLRQREKSKSGANCSVQNWCKSLLLTFSWPKQITCQDRPSKVGAASILTLIQSTIKWIMSYFFLNPHYPRQYFAHSARLNKRLAKVLMVTLGG